MANVSFYNQFLLEKIEQLRMEINSLEWNYVLPQIGEWRDKLDKAEEEIRFTAIVGEQMANEVAIEVVKAIKDGHLGNLKDKS